MSVVNGFRFQTSFCQTRLRSWVEWQMPVRSEYTHEFWELRAGKARHKPRAGGVHFLRPSMMFSQTRDASLSYGLQ